MIPNRTRLAAASLCALLLLALSFFIYAAENRSPEVMVRNPSLVLAPADLAPMPTFDVEEEPAPASFARTATPPPGDSAIAVAVPRIAYTYGYGFRLDSGAVAAVQERHLGLCRRLGQARCRVVSLERGAGEGGPASAQLNLRVAAALAEEFGRGLTAISADAGAETIDRAIAAEDLSRQMIDSEARIRTRETLIRRLTGLLETRSGNIEQAVQAERAINTAQEELEAARAWLAEMRGRVAMSAVEITYVARGPILADATNPIADALDRVGTVSAASLAMIIMIAGVALPWLVLGLIGFLLIRLIRRRGAQAIELEAEISSAN